MRFIGLPIIILSGLIFITSCLKEHGGKADQPRSTYLVPDDFKAYFYFAPGSYWIYQNQRTGALDSVYIVDRSSRMVHYSNIPVDEELVFVHYYDSYYKVMFEENTENSRIGNDSLKKFHWALALAAKYGFGTGGGDYAFIYPCVKGNQVFEIDYYFQTISVTDTQTINNKFYSDIVKFYSPRNKLFENRKTEVYYLKNIGIVRKFDLTYNDDWRLIRYNVLR